jgi:hypothetical protein
MKTWFLLLMITIGPVLKAQLWADSVGLLPVKLKTSQVVWLEQAQVQLATAYTIEQELIQKKQVIDQLNHQAEAAIEAKQKRRLLQEVLLAEARLAEISKRWWLQKVAAAKYHRLALQDLLDDSRGASRALAYEKAVTDGISCFRKAQSREKKLERVDQAPQAAQVATDLWADYHEGLSHTWLALRLCYGLAEPQPQPLSPEPELTVNLHHTALATPPITRQTDPDSVPDLVFRVQIAASATELGYKQLRAIYTPAAGELIYSELDEGWYKYTIGNASTYEQVVEHKLKSGVKGAFVVAYRSDRRLPVTTISAQPPPQTTPQITDSIEGVPVVYRIQIAATRQPVNPQKIKALGMGSQMVMIAFQDGWYKFTLGNYPTLEQARSKLKQLALVGAFVAAYDMAGQEIRKIDH